MDWIPSTYTYTNIEYTNICKELYCSVERSKENGIVVVALRMFDYCLGHRLSKQTIPHLFFQPNTLTSHFSLLPSPLIDRGTHRTNELCSLVGCFARICAWTQLPDLDIRCPLRSSIFLLRHICISFSPRITLPVSFGKTMYSRFKLSHQIASICNHPQF
jgi:hypothetical protein